MFTDCPACGRRFRLRAGHLAAARGQVRCGFCGKQFDALKRLRDEPLPHRARPAAAPGPTEQARPKPKSEGPPPAAPEPEFELAAEQESAEFALDLAGEPVPRRGWRVFWGMAALLLVFASVVQAGWFNRAELLSRFPKLQPAARQWCERLRCDWMQHRDLSAISLINRDVRLHPVFEDALLVNATMANTALYTQPYPRVQLVLFDTGGRAMAQRIFDPFEYLDASIDAGEGMKPHVPVHFALEVAGDIDDAVGFEFGFL